MRRRGGFRQAKMRRKGVICGTKLDGQGLTIYFALESRPIVAVIILGGTEAKSQQSRQSARAASSTSATWPGTFTLRQTRARFPVLSIR